MDPNKNNNNNNKDKKKTNIEKRKREARGERDNVFDFFFLFASLFNIWSFDCRNSLGKERKMLYSMRATREYKKQGISPRF